MNKIKRKKSSERSSEIQRFILDSIASGHKKNLVTFVAKELGLSRQAIYLHVRKLIDQEKIVATGKTKSRSYELKKIFHEELIEITPELEEHVVWKNLIQPILPDLPRNVYGICFHGFTEMFNNVKDHSAGTYCRVSMTETPLTVTIGVDDNGVGIFNKLKKQFGFEDEYHAALELAKGKLTTDKQRHSGEGIFFTSRMFDVFTIHSRGFVFLHEQNDWILDAEDKENTIGTSVSMKIAVDSKQTKQKVFDEFATRSDYGFVRTVVPIKLAKYGDENLVSRSQAKRVLARLENFQIAMLDFKDVDEIGQAFADEVFRVFNLSHPDVHLDIVNANKQVNKVIQHVLSATDIDLNRISK